MKKRFLFLFLISGLVLLNGCQKELSVETGGGFSEGSLQDDGAGDCLPKTVSGAYAVGVALAATNNYIDVEVNITKTGSYTIYTDTVNGMHFRATGVFTATGLVTVRLGGKGTPLAIGISNFIVNYGISGCTIAVTTVGSLATFTLDGAPGGCMGAAVGGTYTANTILNASNNVTINVNVTAVGAYNIATTLSNGMIFTGFGVFTTTGAQAIVLTGSGTPTSSGPTSIPVTTGTSTCSFSVNVNTAAGGATFTIVNCASAVVSGTLTAGVALNPATNTIGITVNVATAGAYTITGTTSNNMTFSASGTFAAAGAGQAVTLTGSGNPTAAGPFNVSITGGTAACSVPVTVNAGAGAAIYTVDCSTATLNGYLTKNVPIAPVNTITIDVNVTQAGTYTITTTPVNGITYTASGTFVGTGIKTVTLTGSGTPVDSGPFTINVASGTTPCGFTVDVDPNYGTWTFKVGATTYSGTIYDTGFDNTLLPPPGTIFYLFGDDAAGNFFELDLGDINGMLANGETYKGAPPVTGNFAGVYYDGLTGTKYYGDPVTPGLETNTMNVSVTSHTVATKTIIGTFSGKAILNGGTTLVDILEGAFTVTYP